MAVKDIFKISRKTFVDPKAWLGYDVLKDNTKTFWAFFKAVFFPETPKAERKETFEEAVARLELTEENIQNIDKNYVLFAFIFGVAGLGLFIFALFLLFDAAFLGCLLALSGAAILLSKAFKFHFWHFQIKHRKLGCTFDEWRSGRPKNEASSS